MPTALVTGPTAGIGRSFAVQLAAQGYDLVLVARDEARLAALADELTSAHGVRAEVLAADLTDRESLDSVGARLADRARPVDLLVNNAGFGLKGRFLDNDIEAEQAQHDVLVTAVLRLSHAALGAMAERGSGGIINVSSVAAFLPRGTYSAAKAWVNSFSEWAHNEYRTAASPSPSLCPGFTKTEFHERMGVGRELRPRLHVAGRRRAGRDRAQGPREGQGVLDPLGAVQGDRDDGAASSPAACSSASSRSGRK